MPAKTVRQNPGRSEAVSAGCTCPVIDNHFGQGVVFNGKRQFWITEGCPIHTAEDGAQDVSE